MITSRRRFLKSAAGTSLGGILGAAAGPAAHGQVQLRPRNILLLMCDQLRFDGLGYAGNRFAVTPVLDRMADSGVVFSRSLSAIRNLEKSEAERPIVISG